MKTFLFSLFIFVLINFNSVSLKTENKVPKILHQVFDSVKSLKTLQYKVLSVERTTKIFSASSCLVKMQMHPFKVYFHNPAKKIEILYNPNLSEHKALVKSNNVFNIYIMLDPNGSLMRKNQHYTIFELGFDFIGKTIALIIGKDKSGINNISYHGKCVKNGYSCYLLEYENPNFDFEDYIVGKKETVNLIAYKLNVNEHIVRYKNKLMNDFSYLKEGEVIKVPNLFCKKAVLYIDEKSMLPVSASLFDDEGLYESYDFIDIQTNTHLTEDDFNKNNKEYHF